MEIANVTDLNPAGNVKAFFDKFFGLQEGHVYCPITDPGDASKWQPYFFKWPSESEKLIEHVTSKKNNHDIYFSPTLFKSPDLKRELVYGTRFLWTEFNGQEPNEDYLKKIPEPSMKMRTSVDGHEVWFWQMEFFSKNMEDVEPVLKSIAYHLNGDLSSWHHESVLRLPNTINHGTGLSSFLFDKTDKYSPLEAFKTLPEAPHYLNEEAYVRLPNFEDVIAYREWARIPWEFFKKKDPLAGREKPVEEKDKKTELRKAYVRLAFDVAEMGYDDKEILVILLNADNRWKRYADRSPEARRRELVGIINFVRKKVPLKTATDNDLDGEYEAFGLMTFLAREINLEWAIEDLIEKQGLGMVTGASGTGKTRFMLTMCIHLALGRDFLKWKCNKPMKMLFCSLEMNEPALKLFVRKMVGDIPQEEMLMLEENLKVFAYGASTHFDKVAQQPKFNRLVDSHRPDGIIIDSLGVAVQDDIENAKVVNAVLEYVNRDLRKKLGAFVLFIHHHKKDGGKSGKPKKDDIFGSVYIYNQMTTIVTLHTITPVNIEPKILEVTNPKLRLAEEFKPFKIVSNMQTIQFDMLGPGGVKTSISDPKSVIQKLVSGGFGDFDED